MLTCEVVRSPDRFYELQSEWEELLSQFEGDNLFLSWPWIRRWVEVYGPLNPLLVIVLRDSQGPVAITPFKIRMGFSRGWLNAREIRLFGSGECCSDYLDILVRQDVRQEALRGVLETLLTECRQEWDVLEYGNTLCESEQLRGLSRLAALDSRCRAVEIEDSAVCPFMPLLAAPAGVLDSQSGKHKYSVERSLRGLREQGGLIIRWCTTEPEVETYLMALRDLNRRLWNLKGKPGSFVSEQFDSFHLSLARDLLNEGRLLLSHVSVDGQYVGGFYGMTYRGRVYFYIMSTERSTVRNVNMGDVMLLEAMEEGVRRGCTEFDFLCGDEDYKYRWTKSERREVHLRVYNRSTRGRGRLLHWRAKRRWVGGEDTLASHERPGFHRTTDRDWPPALVLGTGVTVLGVLRGLGLAGIRAIQVGHGAGVERRSRYCSSYFEAPDSTSSVETGLASLEACLKHNGLDRAVVIPCSDEANEWVAHLPADRRHQFPTSMPPADTLASLTDKGHLARLLVEHDVPHPATWTLASVADLEKLESAHLEHAFLKPCHSQSFFRRYRVKAMTVSTREEAITRWKQLSDEGHQMVLQDYIPGPASNHYFVDGLVDRHGDLKCAFARQRLRMYPPDYGNSCYQVSRAQGSLSRSITTLQGLLTSTSYRGIFSAEFKLDERDGAYKLLEINCRPWWFIWFAQMCGLPMAEMAYVDALDEPVPTLRFYRGGLSIVDPYYDLNACLERVRAGRMTYGEWLDSWIFARHAHLLWRDPWPSVMSHANGLRRYIARRL